MLSTSSRSFKNKFRAAFWPVHNYELGKFIPMSTLMFCILFNQNVLRILKDSILISEISAEIAGFAKVYCVTPAAALFVIIYAKMINYLTFEKIFYYLSAFFISFFVLFTFVIYPNIHIFHVHPDNLADWMERYPHFKWYISLVGNWGYIVYYSLAELWPNIFYVLLFWQFANELTTIEEAKDFILSFRYSATLL